MTAEECLLCSLFAMVSSDCHVRNAKARTTGLGMLPSETSLADEIWNLHLSTGPPHSLVRRLYCPSKFMRSVFG